MTRRDKWARALEVISLLLAAQGISWALLGSFDPWGIWDGLAARALYGAAELPEGALPFGRLMMVLLGGTDAGFFVLLYVLVRYGVRAGEHWAHRGAMAGMLTWFVIDTAGSLLLGATFNVVLVNIPALLLVGIPLWSIRPEDRARRSASSPQA